MYFRCMLHSSWLICIQKSAQIISSRSTYQKQGTEADLLLALVQVIMGILELPCRALMENIIEYFDGGF